MDEVRVRCAPKHSDEPSPTARRQEPESRSVSGRVMAVLATFDSSHRRQSLASISRRANLPLTTVHRLVHDLEKQAALIRGVDGSYEIGNKMWQLGLLASVHSDLREIALPYMEDVYERGNPAVQLAVLDGLRGLVVDCLAGPRSLPVLSKPGSRLPLHATGVGKVLLAFGTQDLWEAVATSLDRFTAQTVTDAQKLASELSGIRAQGYAVTYDELEEGATSLAMPLQGKGGKVIAALGIVVPSGAVEVSRLIPVMQVTTAALTRKLTRAGPVASSHIGE